MPMSFVFYCLAWSFPSFPPKKQMAKKQMDMCLTYKNTPYRLRCWDTPDRRRKWDEVERYLKHLPEFVNEVFDEQQMKNIKDDMWNYVQNPFHGPQPLLIRKRYRDTQVPLQTISGKHVIWWQIAVERLFCCDDIRNKVMDPSELKKVFATLKKMVLLMPPICCRSHIFRNNTTSCGKALLKT